MEIQIYKNASEIPEKYLPSLVDTQIECWGSRPFDEYMICKNSECRALYSIEDVHGSVENYRERVDDIVNFECLECCNGVEQYYNQEKFLEETIEYIKGEVSAILLIENEKVEGFTVMSKSTVGGLVDYEFDLKEGAYNKNELLLKISKKIFGIENAKNKELVYWNHLYLTPKFRSKNLSFKLLQLIVLLNSLYENIPLIIETRFDSNFYLMAYKMGFIDIIGDNNGYIIQFLQKYKEVLDYFTKNDSFIGKRKFYK